MPLTSTEPVADRVFVVQVRSLFSSVAASMAMAAIFLLSSWIAYEKTAGISFAILGAIGSALNAWRIAVSLIFRKQAFCPLIDRAGAARLEQHFSLPYVGFAVAVGIFGLLTFMHQVAELHMLTVCVIVGYCAGVAANCGLRPKLAMASIVLAIGPLIGVALTKEDDTYSALAVIALALIAGAARSIFVRYDESKNEIAIRISSVSMARRDVLTSLPNRLALQEFYSERMRRSEPGSQMAVHYLDLDGFKPVNDQYGHAIGDQLLRAVAGRLRNCIRQSDMVARLGGDEFAIVQFNLLDEDQAHTLSWRIRDTIHRPYVVDDLRIEVTTSVGTIVSDEKDLTLDALLRLADVELYETKRARQRFGLQKVRSGT